MARRSGISESDYITVATLIRLRVASQALGEILPYTLEGQDDIDLGIRTVTLRHILTEIERWEDHLMKQVGPP